MTKNISIILCTYNEVNYIENTIKLITETIENVEIIIVDDNSVDGTLDKLNGLKKSLNFQLFIRKNEKGLASAFKKGLEESNGNFVGFIDANSPDQILHFNNFKRMIIF